MQGVDRTRRVGERIRRELATLIREIKDPNVDPLTTIVSVDVSRDLSRATVYYTVLGATDTRDTQTGLDRAAGYLRSRLAQSIRLRKMPRLQFTYDVTADRAERIDRLLHAVVGAPSPMEMLRG